MSITGSGSLCRFPCSHLTWLHVGIHHSYLVVLKFLVTEGWTQRIKCYLHLVIYSRTCHQSIMHEQMNQYQSKVNEELGGFCCCGVWVHLPLTLQMNNSQEGVQMSHLTDFCGGFITDYDPTVMSVFEPIILPTTRTPTTRRGLGFQASKHILLFSVTSPLP